MRLLHLTDLHVESTSYAEAWRHTGAIGAAYLWSRRRQYDHGVRQQLVAAARATRPDAMVVTGDLTSQNLPGEFTRARELLAEALHEVPSLVIAGNHDVSTPEPAARRPFSAVFAPWLHLVDGDYPARLDVGTTSLIALDAVLPPRFDASGRVPDPQLQRLRSLLDGRELQGRQVVLCLHHPLFGLDGRVYRERRHGLHNVDSLLSLLQTVSQPPQLVLHGHLHEARHHRLSCGRHTVHVLNPGAGCHAGRRGPPARFAVYDIGPQGVRIEHWRQSGADFISEEVLHVETCAL